MPKEVPPEHNNQSSDECNGPCRKKQCQAQNCEKKQKKQPSVRDIRGHKGTLEEIRDIASTYIASGNSEMLYKKFVQHAKQLSMTDRLVAPKEIAAILRVSTKTVHRWIHEKRIKPCFDGGERSKRFDILEVIKARRDERDE